MTKDVTMGSPSLRTRGEGWGERSSAAGQRLLVLEPGAPRARPLPESGHSTSRRPLRRLGVFPASLALAVAASAQTLRNDRYELTLQPDHSVRVAVQGLPAQVLAPHFTAMRSEKDPGFHRNHRNYPLAPRTAVRWANYQQDLDGLNRRLATPDVLASTGSRATVSEDAKGRRTWTYRDEKGQVLYQLSDVYAMGTIDPYVAGDAIAMKPSGATVQGETIRWRFDDEATVRLSAQVRLPPGNADPVISWEMNVSAGGFYSVLYDGAPQAPADEVLTVPQECFGRQLRQWNFVAAECDLKLPRAQLTTKQLHSILIIDPKESPFRLPDRTNSRFGMMIERRDGKMRPVAVAPMLGGPESKMAAGDTHRFSLRYAMTGGDWMDAYRYVARQIYDFRDLRDNSGPGSLNGTIERLMDYLADRNGRNHAIWHAEQKYYDYWTDKSGVFKPFSPLYGLSAALVTDDEGFYRARALPAVEFALSRKSNIFSPYDVFDNGMISNPTRAVGAPYVPLPQLVSLDSFFAGRTHAIRHYAKEAGQGKPSLIDLVAQHRATGDAGKLVEIKKQADAALNRGGATYMDWLEAYEATGEKRYLEAAVEGAYKVAASEMNLFPAVPDETVVMERGGKVPVHAHSFGRHRLWGFPPPEPFPCPEQAVPAWRPALTGIISDAYRGGLWMHHHGQFMRLAALADDDFLRDLARWGVVGRFGNYNGDNRSSLSLIVESPDAIENPVWKLNFSTINPGHAWEFVGEMLDFLVSDAFHRSGRQIEFPSESMSGSPFQVKVYGGRPGRFYDEQDVHLWLPRKLLAIDNRQVDYLAGFGNGKLYLALWNQSFRDEDATATVNPSLANLTGTRKARVWRQNQPAAPVTLDGGTLKVRIPAKGIVAYAIEGVDVKTGIAAKRLDPSGPKLGPDSLVRTEAPFGKLHAMLISMGKGLTNAFIYTDALPEDVIEARLKYRQGEGQWKTLTDGIFPYEFSVEYDEGAGPMQLQFEVEDADQQVRSASVITLRP